MIGWFLVDSWSRAPDQIQMYPDRDTIVQLLPAHQIKQHDFAKWSLKGIIDNTFISLISSSQIYTSHLLVTSESKHVTIGKLTSVLLVKLFW